MIEKVKIMKRLRLNPIYKKELKTGVRSFKTSLILLGFNGLLALFGLFAFYLTFEYGSRYGGRVNYSDILRIYAVIAATEFGLVLFTVPALTAGSISGEREKQTLEILLTTGLKPIQLITGKLTSSISIMLLLAFSSLPVMGLVFSIGGITLGDLAVFMLLVIVIAIFLGSIGIFFSTLFKRTTAATVSTYGTLLILVVGTFILIWAVAMLDEIRYTANVTGIYLAPDVGNWLLLLLINPAITCYVLIEAQTGTGSNLTSFFRSFGTISPWIEQHWFILSVVIQLAISVILIWWTAKLLDPLKEKGRKIRK
jgi:ABC-type transport system involved in multi-copper enzyme maturation permease subunit